jgi:3-hydroxyacyl-CoA dehydrogenase/enoyl-CoA hydratase/3-hydroxybutyryl-CoA epimerase
MGVVGAGFMGAAIAEVAAAAEISVRVRDLDAEAVARGLANIREIVDEGVARRRFEAREGREIMQRISGGTEYSGFGKVDLVIEAVFEDRSAKRKVIRELETVLPREAVIASNTSAIPISDLAADSAHPERIVGMHFFSPAQRMPLLEVVRPTGAADWAVARAVAAGTKLGKTVIVVADSPGFYTSRVLGVMMNEAVLLLDDGASVPEVDRAMVAFGFPVGPFVLYDEVGLQVAQHAGETVAGAFGDRFPPARLVVDLVARGDTGRKAGRGFYLWPRQSRLRRAMRRLLPGSHRAVNPVVQGAVTISPGRRPGAEEMQNRLVLLFVNEAIRCLEEGVLQSPTEGDLGAVLGLGFPPFRGGPFHYADAIGLDRLANTLRRLAARHGPRYEPASSLVDRARVGRTFYPEG